MRRRPGEVARIPGAMGIAARLAAEHARAHGLALRPLLEGSGLTQRELADSKSRISVAHQIAFLNRVADALGDERLGLHLALELELRRAGLFYYVLASSDSLLDILERGARFTSIVNDGVLQECVKGRHVGLALSYTGVRRLNDRHQIEFWLVTLIRLCRHLTGRHLRPVRVRLTHLCPGGDRAFDRFLGCDAEYGAGRDEILFARADGALRNVNADPFLNRLLVDVCEQALSRHRRGSDSFVARVENAIAPKLPHGGVRAAKIAAELGLSERTFARRLAEEGLTFSQLLERLRLDLARRYLGAEGLPVSRVAWLLGYQQVGAFSHAFRRWTGGPPSAHLRKHPGRRR